MAARSSWEGFLKINLVSVPVKAFTATVSGGGKIGFNMVHAKCNSRIRYQKVCPVHGEVSADEIVPGYEVAKGEYVLMDKKELAKLKGENEKAIRVDAFVSPERIDPAYYSGRTYYLAPDGKLAQKSYAVVQQAMRDYNRYGVAEIVFAGREQLVAVRPVGRLLAMTFLKYQSELKPPAAFEDQAPDVDVSAKELKLAESLIEAATEEDFDLGQYQDDYDAQVRTLIERRAGSRKAVSGGEHEEPAVINLMDALRQSLDQSRKTRREPRAKPARKGAARRGSSKRKTG